MFTRIVVGTDGSDTAEEAVSQAIEGQGVRMMIDTNHAYGVADAARLGRALEPYDLRWYEEPLDPREIASYLRSRGLRAQARAHFGFGRNPLLPAINQVASWFGTLPLRYADRYLVIATK